MKDLTPIQRSILELLLRRRSAQAEEIAAMLKLGLDVVRHEIQALRKDGWIQDRIRVQDDRLRGLGYNHKFRFNLFLNTNAPGRSKEFPNDKAPESLAVAVVSRLKNHPEMGPEILVGRLYLTLGGRLDASFSMRCKDAKTKDLAKQLLESLPGVESVSVYTELLIGL